MTLDDIINLADPELGQGKEEPPNKRSRSSGKFHPSHTITTSQLSNIPPLSSPVTQPNPPTEYDEILNRYPQMREKIKQHLDAPKPTIPSEYLKDKQPVLQSSLQATFPGLTKPVIEQPTQPALSEPTQSIFSTPSAQPSPVGGLLAGIDDMFGGASTSTKKTKGRRR